MKTSSSTMMPSTAGVSRLARRLNSMSSLVTIALEDVAVIPAMISASRVPQPIQRPRPKPTAMLIRMRVPPETSRARRLP